MKKETEDGMNAKVYNDIMGGKSDYNIKYVDFQNIIIDLGFELKRQKGSHTMYYHNGIKEWMNIQKDGSKAKAYQVRQLRIIMIKHGL